MRDVLGCRALWGFDHCDCGISVGARRLGAVDGWAVPEQVAWVVFGCFERWRATHELMCKSGI